MNPHTAAAAAKTSSFHGPTPPRQAAPGSGMGLAGINQAAEANCPLTAPHSIDQAWLAMRAALAICLGWLQAAIWPRAQQTQRAEG